MEQNKQKTNFQWFRPNIAPYHKYKRPKSPTAHKKIHKQKETIRKIIKAVTRGNMDKGVKMTLNY